MESTDRPKLRPLEAIPQEVEGETAILIRDPEGITDKVAALPPGLAQFLFANLTGEHTLGELEERIGGDLGPILSQLDEALFLDSPRFAAAKAALVQAYRDAPSREAKSAGQAYPADPDELREFLDHLYEGVEETDRARPLKAAAIPHLDLRFGGVAAAKGLVGLAGRFTGDTVVILGVGHALGATPYALTVKDFDTPLGLVPVDQELLGRVSKQTGDWVFEGELTHRDEHSVEFAALLLKHALPNRDFRILPVLCGSFQGFHMEDRDPTEDPLVDVFLETLREETGDALILASVDLAHRGPFYGDENPLTPELLRAIGIADVEMIGRMEERDAAGFFAHLTKTRNGRRVCGSSAIYTTLSLLPEGPRGQLKAYEQPPFPEEGNTVTICSMVWE